MSGGSNCDSGSAYHHVSSVLGGIGAQQAGVGNAILESPVGGTYVSSGGKRGRKRSKKGKKSSKKGRKSSSRRSGLSLLRSLTRRRTFRGGNCGCDKSSTGAITGGKRWKK